MTNTGITQRRHRAAEEVSVCQAGLLAAEAEAAEHHPAKHTGSGGYIDICGRQIIADDYHGQVRLWRAALHGARARLRSLDARIAREERSG
jgi:hypothetical protein